MKVESNKVVTFHYRLSDENDTLIEDSFDGDPVMYIHNTCGIIPGLETAMNGRDIAEKFNVTIEPVDGYGLRNETLKQRIPIKYVQQPKKKKLTPGQVVTIQTKEGARQVTVVKVGKFNIDVDANHPLAGRVLDFNVEIVDVRDATKEELDHGHAHGVGGHQHD